MDNELISVIVPVYNSEKTIERCIKSVLAQTYCNWELILVDDGSIDKSCKIIDSFCNLDNRVKKLMKMNGGVSSARNFGINNSTGKYVTFLDSDDAYKNNYLEKMHESLIKNDAQVVICGYTRLPENKVTSIEDMVLSIDDLKNKFIKIFETNCLNIPWNKMYKREVIKSLFMESISIGEDLIFNLKNISLCSRICFISEPLYDYYLNDLNSLSFKYQENAFDAICEMQKTIKEFIGEAKFTENIRDISNWMFDDFWRCIDRLIRLSNKTNKQKKEILNTWFNTIYYKTLKVNLKYVNNSRKKILNIQNYYLLNLFIKVKNIKKGK